MTNLVIQSFGRENEYKRAILTILSYYALTSLPLNETKVILFTDEPGYFVPYLKGLPVDYVKLTAQKIRQMRGKIDFLHHMKISMIEEAFGMINGNMLYADSDTFFLADPTRFLNELEPGKSFMHVLEYEFENLRNMELPAGKTFLDFLMLIEANQFHLANGKKLKITSKHCSWNAGVMMFHDSQASLLADVYVLTEQFYPATLNHASEQYAFSIVLQNNTNLQACEEVIFHYWHRVKKEIIDSFLNKKLSLDWANQSLDQKLTKVKIWTEMLPQYFDYHFLSLKDNAIQAFNRGDFRQGYKWAFKALFKGGFSDLQFVKDVIYHSKRKLKISV